VILTKPELIDSLQNEVRIPLHLASKIDRTINLWGGRDALAATAVTDQQR
jgi:hypothetical protein